MEGKRGGSGGGDGGSGWRGRRLTFLTAAQLLDALLVVVFAVEADADADAGVVLDAFAPCVVVGVVVVVVLRLAIGLALDDETAAAGGDEFLEDGGEFARDLFEGAFDGFVFALVQHGDEVLDRGLRRVELGAAFGEGVALGGEVVVLLEGFLVHVTVFLERFVDFV